MDSARILAKVPLIVENTQFAKLLNTDRFASARLATKDPDLVMDVSKLDAKLTPTAPEINGATKENAKIRVRTQELAESMHSVAC